MTNEATVALLESELELGEALIETLESQRSALLERDLDQMEQFTDLLEEQLELFLGLLEKRSHMPEEEIAATGPTRALLDRLRRTEVRVIELAEFNEKLIADRLAWSNAMLAALGMAGTEKGYGPDSDGLQTSQCALSRSA